MAKFALSVAFCVCCSTCLSDDSKPGAPSAPVATQAVRKLASGFDAAQRTAFEAAAQARTDAERQAAKQAMPDRRQYARRFLEIANATNDEAAAVDSVVWVIQHAARTPEMDEAVRMLANRYLRSNRIGPACVALRADGADAEALLKRMVNENPNPLVRGRACLGMAFARSMEARRDWMSPGASLPPNRPKNAQPRQLELEKRNNRSIGRTGEIELWLKRVVDDFPGTLLEPDIMEHVAFLPENLGPTAHEILRRVAETHPLSEVRWDAECGLAMQQMALASLVARARAVALTPAGAKRCSVPAQAAACVYGGEPRLLAVNSETLVSDIEHRLRKIAEHASEVKKPGLCYFHLIIDIPTLSYHYSGAELLLRRVALDADPRSRAGAQRALAIVLSELAELSQDIDSDRAYWIDRLGQVRVEQIRQMGPQKLMTEASTIAEQLATQYPQSGKAPDPKIEAIRNRHREHRPKEAVRGD